MYARTTLFEIDTLRISLTQALEHFKRTVLPALRTQPGCRGVIAMETPEGKGMLVTLWETQEAAAVGLSSGFYDSQVAQFLMFLRQPPGREDYEVVYMDLMEAKPPAAPVNA